MILVITRDGDLHGHHMIAVLRESGARVEKIDYSWFPTRLGISSYADQCNISLPNGTRIRGNEVTSVLYRREASPEPPNQIQDENIRGYITREAAHMLENLPMLIPAYWVSSPDAVRVASRKPYHLRIARHLGFQTPRTLFTNSPDEAREFVSTMQGIAVKTLWSPGIRMGNEVENKPLALFTRKLDRKTVAEHLSRIRNCPMVLQEYVEKKFELRITVVGQKVLACAIWSQSSPHTQEDWRRYDLHNTPHEAYDLPAPVEDMCRTLLRELGLRFGCIDMIVTPEGNYVFLEINPNGQWLWIEQLTGLPISQTLAQLLMKPC